MRSFLIFGAVTLSGACIAVGCNSVLGNETGTLGGTDASVAHDATIDTYVPPPETDSAIAPAPDAASDEDTGAAPDGGVAPPEDAAPPVTCPDGQKRCDNACVSVLDPLFGCTPTSCTPCAMDRASAACSQGACAIAQCNAGYADCNQNPADGCETDLSQASHCGSCNAVCGAGAPNCAPSAGGFACTTGCAGSAPTLCGNQCVDLVTSPTHCGSCNTVCPAVANGTTDCVGSQCQFSCGAGFHACGSGCASNQSVTTCGNSCTPCTPPANAQATCDGSSCGFVCNNGFHLCGTACVPSGSPATCGGSCNACPAPANTSATCDGTKCGAQCKQGFADCNKSDGDGCEVALASDPLNCGACGVSCNGQACNAGQCATPPPPPPDASVPDSAPPPPPPADAATD